MQLPCCADTTQFPWFLQIYFLVAASFGREESNSLGGLTFVKFEKVGAGGEESFYILWFDVDR